MSIGEALRAKIRKLETIDDASHAVLPFLPSFRLERREALWAIKGLRDEPMPLFEAADEREKQHAPEVLEPEVTLKPMTAGREVVEDYRHIGLTLRQHPVCILRETLTQKQIITCKAASTLTNKRMATTAGLVLVQQKPGSAKGVMFITIED